jgi:hypothetical protein
MKFEALLKIYKNIRTRSCSESVYSTQITRQNVNIYLRERRYLEAHEVSLLTVSLKQPHINLVSPSISTTRLLQHLAECACFLHTMPPYLSIAAGKLCYRNNVGCSLQDRQNTTALYYHTQELKTSQLLSHCPLLASVV